MSRLCTCSSSRQQKTPVAYCCFRYFDSYKGGFSSKFGSSGVVPARHPVPKDVADLISNYPPRS